jgi:hypothetical protein
MGGCRTFCSALLCGSAFQIREIKFHQYRGRPKHAMIVADSPALAAAGAAGPMGAVSGINHTLTLAALS